MTGREFLDRIQSLRVLIVGDICLDRWCQYDPSLSDASKETNLPRIAVVASEDTPGAAGTVATNLSTLGAKTVAVLGVVGNDGHGFELLSSLRGRKIETDLLIQHSGVPTFTYTKLINKVTGIEDKPRVDFVLTDDLPSDVQEQVCARLREYAANFDLICVSDQAETEYGGVVTGAVRDVLASVAREKTVWVDSRRRVELFRNAVLKVNHLEAAEARERCESAPLSAVRATAAAPVLFVTHGGNGVQMFTESGETWLMTRVVPDPVDICGAGDGFTAGAACAFALGASPESAARLGHLVASVTIMKKGTGYALPEEVLEAEEHWDA